MARRSKPRTSKQSASPRARGDTKAVACLREPSADQPNDQPQQSATSASQSDPRASQGRLVEEMLNGDLFDSEPDCARTENRPCAYGAPHPASPASPKATGPSASATAGHRARLRARFDRGETLADYELMELVLFWTLPRRDTKPIAKALIAEFGSFAGAIAAPAARLNELEGIGPRITSDFRLIRAAAERFALANLVKRGTLASTDAVAEYYRAKLLAAEREEFHILFLDKKNQFIASECAGVGTVDHTPVYPREVLTRALAHSASAIVLVHNHPSGDPTPSRADVTVTRQIVDAMATVGIAVHDHIIIAGERHLSLRGEGLM